MANLGSYDSTRAYVGYFDAAKCYNYHYATDESDRYFYPAHMTADHTCSSASKEWSGNYLNWAVTQTIDPFRKALTGGYRVRDTTSDTLLEKAWYDGNGTGGIFDDRTISSGLVSGATPVSWSSFITRVKNLGNRMQFTKGGTLGATTPAPIAYDPALTTLDSSKVYEVSVRVRVCDASVGLESNCKQYGDHYKPEGLIQKYSDRIRYSVFGYLNDSSSSPDRDGGALRAKQKFVGAQKRDPLTHELVANPAAEWDSASGVLVQNPDTDDATSTTAAVGKTIADSGVINYINKFGEMPKPVAGSPGPPVIPAVSPPNHKSHDPVSELYYAAIRYLKNQGNIPEYTNFASGLSANTKWAYADGFPVITTWDDPIQYWCQNNAILGIGDVNTWNDKNLPGSTYTTNEPTTPALVSADKTVDVVKALTKITALEGITVPTPMVSSRDDSAFIASLAYDSHTVDLRPDADPTRGLPGKQTVSTYWVDVREAQTLYGPVGNQYWLAAKYGGFTVPDGYVPYSTDNTALPTALWNSAGDTLTYKISSSNTNTQTGLRPDNFFVASEADKMVESLTRAFAKISQESTGSSSSLAANSTRLDTSTRTYQALFVGGTWRGDLKAFAVNTDGTLATNASWSANTNLLSATWSSRSIYTNNAGTQVAFAWANLSSAQQTALGSQKVVDYLRGKRSDEEAQPGGTLRTRTGVLGDIVNSTPIYVGAPNSRLYVGASFTGASTYGAFVTSKASRTPVVYVGANDGMLHGFNANTGAETYAFVPNTAILNGLKSYSDPSYTHQYFVDGEMAVADVYDTSGSGAWKTILVGSLGRGGPGIFALDVTNPASVQFLWEKSGSDIPALGRNIGKPVIAQVANGDWRVVMGNGPDASGGPAELISVGIFSGTVYTVDTGATGSNGLGAVLARDTNGDGFADTAYAGDLKGNLWKVSNFASTSPAPAVLSLFTAKDASNNVQPITTAPLVGRDPNTGKTWIWFGTGQYLSDSDPTNTQTQSWYGLIDGSTAITSRAQLVQRTISAGTTMNGLATRNVSTGTAADIDTFRGWYIDLPSAGERMVVPNLIEGAALIGTTRIPNSSDVCRPSGSGWIMAINPFTGAKLDNPFFVGFADASGLGFESSPNKPIFIQNVMEVSFDNGGTGSFGTNGGAVQAQRMSWRELTN